MATVMVMAGPDIVNVKRSAIVLLFLILAPVSVSIVPRTEYQLGNVMSFGLLRC